MKAAAASFGLWISLIVVTIIEVVLFYTNPGSPMVNVGIIILAAVNAVLISAFTMNLKNEGKPIQYMMIVPLLFALVLIVTLIFSFPTR